MGRLTLAEGGAAGPSVIGYPHDRSMRPEVTAVITTHARPASALDALASVRTETHEDIEVIVVDDGGTFVAPTDRDGAVRVVRGSNLGVARARNLGLAAARGEFIIYLDDDDVALPHRISSLLSAARRWQASLCFGMTRRVAGGGAARLPDVPTHRMSSGAVGFCDLLVCPPHVNAVLVRTATLRAADGFDVEAAHFDDWSAWLRIADRDAVVVGIADTVAEWRIHAQGLSGDVLQIRAMQSRLLALFARLRSCLSPGNARAVAMAMEVVTGAGIVTFDDYVHAMAAARDRLHADGACFGRPLHWHLLERGADRIRAVVSAGA